MAGLLITATRAIRPLGRAISLIPLGIVADMLAGVLLPLCLKAAAAVLALAMLVLPMIAVFSDVSMANPALVVLAALATGVSLAMAKGWPHLPILPLPFPRPYR